MHKGHDIYIHNIHYIIYHICMYIIVSEGSSIDILCMVASYPIRQYVYALDSVIHTLNGLQSLSQVPTSIDLCSRATELSSNPPLLCKGPGHPQFHMPDIVHVYTMYMIYAYTILCIHEYYTNAHTSTIQYVFIFFYIPRHRYRHEYI